MIASTSSFTMLNTRQQALNKIERECHHRRNQITWKRLWTENIYTQTKCKVHGIYCTLAMFERERGNWRVWTEGAHEFMCSFSFSLSRVICKLVFGTNHLPDPCVSLLKILNNRENEYPRKNKKKIKKRGDKKAMASTAAKERKNPFYNMVFTAIHYHNAMCTRVFGMFIIWNLYKGHINTLEAFSRYILWLSKSNDLGIHCFSTLTHTHIRIVDQA